MRPLLLWLLVLTAFLAPLVEGCAVPIPIPVRAAYSSGNAVLFAETGKGATDHALSAALEEDCSSVRWAMRDGEFCRAGNAAGSDEAP